MLNNYGDQTRLGTYVTIDYNFRDNNFGGLECVFTPTFNASILVKNIDEPSTKVVWGTLFFQLSKIKKFGCLTINCLALRHSLC